MTQNVCEGKRLDQDGGDDRRPQKRDKEQLVDVMVAPREFGHTKKGFRLSTRATCERNSFERSSLVVRVMCGRNPVVLQTGNL